MGPPKKPKLTLAQHAAVLRAMYPNSKTTINKGLLTWRATIQPMALARLYRVELQYRLGEHPKIRVLEPNLRELSGGAASSTSIPRKIKSCASTTPMDGSGMPANPSPTPSCFGLTSGSSTLRRGSSPGTGTVVEPTQFCRSRNQNPKPQHQRRSCDTMTLTDSQIENFVSKVLHLGKDKRKDFMAQADRLIKKLETKISENSSFKVKS